MVFQIIDHCTIYVLIAGTYVPVTLLGLASYQPYNYIILGVVVLLAILGVVLNATMMRKIVVKVISMILYIAVGWGIIFFYPWLIAGPMGMMGTWFLILGGITYTIGSILYGIGSKKRYWHSIFHMFVVLGTVFQFLSVFLFCICGL
jgi:hemolysin III